MLKLLNNNFLCNLLKTGSVAHLHIGLSEWHETHMKGYYFPMSP